MCGSNKHQELKYLVQDINWVCQALVLFVSKPLNGMWQTPQLYEQKFHLIKSSTGYGHNDYFNSQCFPWVLLSHLTEVTEWPPWAHMCGCYKVVYYRYTEWPPLVHICMYYIIKGIQGILWNQPWLTYTSVTLSNCKFYTVFKLICLSCVLTCVFFTRASCSKHR